MADGDSIRQRIVSSVFTTKLVDETYVAHIKIWEEDAADEGGKKPRYIILSSMLSSSIRFAHVRRYLLQSPVMGLASSISLS